MTMKTPNTPKLMTIIAVLALFILNGCESDSKSSSTDDNKKSRPIAPQIDMHSAVIANNLEAIKQHIRAGSDLNQKDPFGGSSPLISAALFGKTEIVQVLLNANVDINFVNNDGATALHTAAFFCRPEIVKLLLDKGIDKNIRNNMNTTAYGSVSGPFKEVKPIYDVLGQSLAPLGLKLDYDNLKKTRPIIAELLR